MCEDIASSFFGQEFRLTKVKPTLITWCGVQLIGIHSSMPPPMERLWSAFVIS